MPQKHTSTIHPMYPEFYKCNSRESTFVEFCVDGINLYVENNFIDSLGLSRDSNPDHSALKPSECTTLLKGLFKTIHPINPGLTRRGNQLQ
jgi:hypothetical protein